MPTHFIAVAWPGIEPGTCITIVACKHETTTYLCSTSCLATLYLTKMYLHGQNEFPVYCSLYTITFCKTFTSQRRLWDQQPCRVPVANLKISNLRTQRRGHDGAICNFAQFLYAYGNCTHRWKLNTDNKSHTQEHALGHVYLLYIRMQRFDCFWAITSTVEKPAEIQTRNRQASSLVRAPDPWSGGHEFESSV